ncbi:MAG: hypothetical protein U1E65_21150 [Myxococcota bacterium]
MLRFALLAAALAFSACEGTRAEFPDAEGPDLGAVDSGTRDAAALPDAMDTADAGGGLDAGTVDLGVAPDAGSQSDSGALPDAGNSGLIPGPGDLVFVELQGNPQTAADTDAEYIELLNVSGRALDLIDCHLLHLVWTGGGMAPVRSVANHRITTSVPVAAGARVLLTHSSGGYFGPANKDYVYSGFEMGNGGMDQNRLRLMAPGWDGTEPPDPLYTVDELVTPLGAFDNALRGRAWQLDPGKVASPSAANNDDPMNWCYAASGGGLAYWSMNWGTPGTANACQ